MKLTKIIKTIITNQKYENLKNQHILIIQPLNHHLNPQKKPIITIDTIQTNPNNIIHTANSQKTTLTLTPSFVPINYTIINIINQMTLNKNAQ